MRLEVRVNAAKALERLEGIASTAANPRSAFDEAGDLFLRKQARFWRSNQWFPLKPDSARRKLKRGRPAQPLIGGGLERSMTVRGARYNVRRVNKMSVVLGSRHPLAHLHNQGSRGALPRRPLIRVTPDDRRQYRAVFVRHLMVARGGRIRSARRSLLP